MNDRPWSEATRFDHFQADRITRGAASQTLRFNHIPHQSIPVTIQQSRLSIHQDGWRIDDMADRLAFLKLRVFCVAMRLVPQLVKRDHCQ